MEARIQALPEVKEATITFTTNQLQVVTEGDKDLLEEFQKICAAIESEVIVKRKVSVNKKEEKKKICLQKNHSPTPILFRFFPFFITK